MWPSQKSTQQMVWDRITHIFQMMIAAYYNATRTVVDIVTIHYYAAVCMMWLMMSLIAAFKLIMYIKGRPGTQKSSQQATNSQVSLSPTVVHVHSAVSNGKPRNPSAHKAMPIDKLNRNTNIESWFKQLELYLKFEVPYDQWTYTTMMNIQHEMYHKLGELDQYTDNPNGFILLKQKLLNASEKRMTVSGYQDIASRKQLPNETAEQFGKALLAMAGDTFKTDRFLIQIFCAGLKTEEVRMKVSEAAVKKEMAEESLSLKEAICLAQKEEIAFQMIIQISGSEYSSYTDSSSNEQRRLKQPVFQNNNFKKNKPWNQSNEFQMPASERQAQDSQPRARNQANFNQGNFKQYHSGEKEINQRANNTQFTRTANCIATEDVNTEPMMCEVIVNKQTVECMLDTGAGITVMSRKLYDKLNTEQYPLRMRPMKGSKVRCVDGRDGGALGLFYAKKVIISSDCILRNVRITILQECEHGFIIGRDVINKIPKIRALCEQMTEIMARNTRDIRSMEIDSNVSDDQAPTDTDLIIFPGFEDNRLPPLEIQTIDQETQHSENESDANATKVRELIQQELETVTTDVANDIDLSRNNHIEFRINLVNPNQKAIRCKSRPLPQAIKHRVKEALDQQLAAGIIRPSFSEWASPLHVVIKPDGSIRITVDYKILNTDAKHARAFPRSHQVKMVFEI